MAFVIEAKAWIGRDAVPAPLRVLTIIHLNLEPVFADGGKHIDPAGLQGWAGLLRMTAPLVEGAGTAEPAGRRAWPGAQ